jgi:hypothetical protein
VDSNNGFNRAPRSTTKLTQMYLLELASALRNAVPETRSFNVFNAIRCESDEVFLHSRLIAALITPKAHPYSDDALSMLLKQVGIPLEGKAAFFRKALQVRAEFRGIDILISNDAGQAIIFENKIYAADQPRQLRRYYDTIRELGYTEIYIRYLTLDGREPSDDSLDGLQEQLKQPWLSCVSYGSEIRQWVDELISVSVRTPALRETLFQYQDVIDRLTGQGRERVYMHELVNVLLRGNNMTLARDITTAYTHALVELQERFWRELVETIQVGHGEVAAHAVNTSVIDPHRRKAAIAKYYEPSKKDRMYYGLHFSIPGYDCAEVCLQIERALYVGVSCEKGRASKDYRQVAQLLKDANIGGDSNDTWPFWRFIRDDQNFAQPDEALLSLLSDEQLRKEFVENCAVLIAELWLLLVPPSMRGKTILAPSAMWPFPTSSRP